MNSDTKDHDGEPTSPTPIGADDPGCGELSPEGKDALAEMSPDEFMRENSGVLKALRSAYSEIVDEPMPDRFMQLLEQLNKSEPDKE